MAITFPASPVNGQTHTENGQIFVFDSTRGYWLLKKQDQIVASTSRSTFVATAGQTVHTVNYDPSASVIVSVNGVMLNPQDITSTNGTSIIFDTALALSDEVDIVFHQPTASNLIRQDISDPMATESYVQTYVTNNSSVGVTTVADMAALIALTGMANGDQALVTANNNLFIYSGSGWYKIATVQNDSPSAITGVSGTYELAVDGTATVITAVSTDPEGFPLTWSYSASGIGSIATVSQSDNVFTITPSTTEADAGTFTLTINATDGVNGAVSTSTNLTLEFIIIVTNSRYTTLLATATGTSDNNNITDSSTNNHTITVSGDAHAGTFSPYRSGDYSMYFDGSDYVDLGNGNLAINTEDFTIETWVNVALGSNMSIANNSNWNSGNNTGWRVLITTAGLINLTASQGSWNSYPSIYASTNAIPSNEWVHVVICRDSGVISSYINGIKDPTTVNYSASLNQTGGSSLPSYSLIGAYLADGYEYNNLTGYLSDFHFKLGSAKYTTTFSPPTERLTVESGTDVLLFNKPFLKDESTNAYTISISGDPKIKPFSPYDYLEYAAADHGGAINFDGTGDYLTIPDHSSLNFSSNDWTIECWIYPRTNVGDCGIWHQSASGGTDWFSLYLDGSFNPKFVLRNNNAEEWAGTAAANTAPQNTWTHIALVRRFGTDIKLYANGKVVHTETQHLNVALENKTYNHVIGYERFVGNGTYFDGLISDFKMDIGTAHYTAEFTPPTAPLSSTASDLHIKGTDASIIDKSQSSNLKLFGNTTGSTTQVKFGGSKSMYFDGTGDYITAGADAGKFGTDDFTIETWLRSSSWNKGLFRKTTSGSSSSPPSISVYIASATILIGVNSGTADGTWMSATNPFTLNTWGHLAITRVSGLVNVYADGSRIISTTRAVNVDNDITFRIGEWRNSTEYFTGYLQDFRITKGLARYTAADETSNIPSAPLEG